MSELTDWQPYSGEYNKGWYNVKIATGEVVRDCWPNAGGFHSFHEVDQYKGRIDGSRVTEIQEVDDPFFRVDEKKKGGKRRGKKYNRRQYE